MRLTSAGYVALVPSVMATPDLQQQDSSGNSAEEWAPPTRASSPVATSPEDGVRRCKVDGCGLDLTHHKTFFHRARCCPPHARELTVHLEGEAKRLCQQCSSFHPLADFDGTKRSCRTRLESHKIRQREHHNRRMAAAAAAMQRQAAVAVAAMTISPAPAATPGVHLPAISSGQAANGLAFLGQQLPLEGTQQVDVLNLWGPLQQPTPWQHAQQGDDVPIAQQHAQHMAMLTQQQQRQEQQQMQQQPPPPPSAADLVEAPSIFADMPVEELPLAMHPGHQPSWEQPAVDVHKLSSFWEGPPPPGCQAFDAGAAAGSSMAVSVGEVDLQQPLPLIERYGIERTAPGSVRSMSADTAGAACWADRGGARGGEAALSRLGSAARQCSHTFNTPNLQRSSASELLCHGDRTLEMMPRYDSAHEEERRPTFRSPFDPSFTAPQLSGHTPVACNVARDPPASQPARPRSIKRASLNAYDMPTRFKFASAKRSSLEVFRSDSASSDGCGDFRRLAAAGCAGRGDDMYQRSSLGDDVYRRSSLGDSRGSHTGSPSLDTPPTGSGTARSSVRRHTMAGRCDSGRPRSIKRASLTVLPDADMPDLGLEAEDPAFAEQAPEPLYLAAQLVREMGLPDRQLPEFSYGRSCSASTSSSPGATVHNADTLLPPGARALETAAVDEIGSAALKALLRSEDTAVLEDVSQRLQRLACSIAVPRATAAPPPAMGRRIRRRSADSSAVRCGMLSLVA